VRITRDQPDIYPLDPARFTQPVEHELHRLVEAATHPPRKSGSVDGFLNSFLPLIPVINRYFEEVLVMDEDPALRVNRLGQLQRIAALSSGVADLSKLEGF
jgi:glycyl-tRNA synthetase